MNGSGRTASHTPPLDHAAVRSIIIGILLAMLLGALDQTIVVTALPTMGRDLGDVEHLPWVVTAYLLTATTVTPLYGKLSDIHGRRVTMLISIGIFVIGSLFCALAPRMLVLIIARGLQGLGGGGLISLAQTIIADIVSPRERARYQAHIAAVFVTSSLLGPVLGGFFAQHLHWSMIFWINLPLGLVAFLMTNNALRRLPRHERPHQLDFLGAGLMVIAATTLLLALTWGGSRYAWLSGPILSLFGTSLLFWCLFVVRLLTAREPFLPLSVMRNQVVATGTLAACFVMGSLIGLSVYVTIYLQLVHGMAADRSGLALIPLMGGTVTGATISGRLMAKIHNYKRPAMAGLFIAIVACAMIGFFPARLPLVWVEILLGVIGVGLGTLLPVTTVGIQNAVESHEIGTATGSMNFFRSLGSAIAVAAFGAILLGGGGLGPVGGAVALSHMPMAQLASLFGWIFLAAAAGLAIGLVWLLLMEQRPLRGPAEHARAPGPHAAARAAR